MKDIQILDDEDKILILNESKKIRKRLSELTDSAETWYGFDEPCAIKQAEECISLIKGFYNFMFVNKDGSNHLVDLIQEKYYIDEIATKEIVKLDF